MSSRGLFALLLVLIMAACTRPAEVRPALWQVDGPQGEKAWLFGTIHALPEPVDWRSPRIEAAMAGADRLVMEIADIENREAIADQFKRLDATAGLPPLAQRLPAADRPRLAALVKREGIDAQRLDRSESWAAALILAQVQQARSGSDSANGIDRAVASAMRGKPVVELEGAARQLGIFDALAEADQRQLLGFALAGAEDAGGENAQLVKAWSGGDMAMLGRQTHEGMLADPELHEALLAARNQDWAGQIDALLRRGAQPFVAVGAMHLAGPEGLPALLTERGWKVTRVQ